MSEPAPQPTPQPFPFQIWSSLPMDMWRRGWETWSSLMLDAPMRWMTGNQQLFTRGASAWQTAPMAWWALTTSPGAPTTRPDPAPEPTPEPTPEPAVLPALKSVRAARTPASRKLTPAADITDAEVADTPVAGATAVATAEPAATPAAAAAAPAAPATPDNLQAIKGIGPKLGAILNDLGVTTYAQIAGWSADDIRYIESKLDFPGRVTREKWIDQAKSLMA